VDCRRLDDLDAVFEFDTCDDLRQLICVFQSPLAHIPFWSNRGIPKGLRIDDSGGIDSVFFWGTGMPRPYSDDLRRRAIEAVEVGASRHEVAERFDMSPSTVINWMQRWREDGSAAAKPSGGSVSPLEKYANWFLSLVTKQPDLTLDEIVATMAKRRMAGSRSAVSRFYIRHNVTFKKKGLREVVWVDFTPKREEGVRALAACRLGF
jgi:transposase